MPPDEYRNVIKILETHYQEFLRTSQGSEMFGEEDRKIIQGRFDDAQKNYYDLIIQLPAHGEWESFYLILKFSVNCICQTPAVCIHRT